jgi:hypothetical protein
VDVVTHLFDHCLHGCGLAHYIYLLGSQVVDSVLQSVYLLVIALFLFLSMEADQHLEDLLIAEPLALLSQFSLNLCDLLAHTIVVFLHGLVVAENGLADLLLKIREEAFDDGQHLGLGFLDAFPDSFLFLGSEDLLISDFLAAVGEFFGGGLEEGVNVVGSLDDAEW